jgi:hypothetical protein
MPSTIVSLLLDTNLSVNPMIHVVRVYAFGEKNYVQARARNGEDWQAAKQGRLGRGHLCFQAS